MSRHHHICTERGDQIARSNPILERSRPNDRRSIDEQDVAGVHDFCVGNVHDDITVGVRRPHFHELDDATANLDVESTVERSCWRRQRDIRKVEITKKRAEQLADFARRLVQRGEQLRWNFAHFLGCRGRGDDLGIDDSLVAVTVIAIRMGVHHGGDWSCTRHRLHGRQHRIGEFQVEEGVDQQRLTISHHQSCIAVTPTTVRLQVCKAIVVELLNSELVVEHVVSVRSRHVRSRA